jgi:hypothetical protein
LLQSTNEKGQGSGGHLAWEGFALQTGCHKRSGYAGSVEAGRPHGADSTAEQIHRFTPVTAIGISPRWVAPPPRPPPEPRRADIIKTQGRGGGSEKNP